MSKDLMIFAEMQQLAKAVADSGLFGMGSPSQALALMSIAQAEGRHPALAARDYHVFDGKATLKADTVLARFQVAGGVVKWHEYSNKMADATFSHPVGGQLRISLSFEEVMESGICMGKSGVKDNWKKFPRAMLRARLVCEGVRTIWPDVFCGFYAAEEFDRVVEKDITPIPAKEVPQIAKETRHDEVSSAINDLRSLVSFYEISKETVDVWLEKSGADSISNIPDEFALKLINGINKKYEGEENVNIN